eukprot:TRINITY_DN8292_c0_g1_i2.p1 TRINITY_DN8292_c0_g1~~TRINITY_DN8292_c0_g1_i2.p1  ORF type:complete len:148 (-),score=8.91 TRINITY_DN8292_c0_g1_i2:124-567(-)
MEEPSPLEIVEVPTKIQIVQFVELIRSVPVYFQIYYLSNSYYIWVGTQPSKMKNLTVGILNSRGSLPSSSTVIGNAANDVGKSITERLGRYSSTSTLTFSYFFLVKRTGKPIYFSYSVTEDIPHVAEWVEKQLVTQLKSHKMVLPQI